MLTRLADTLDYANQRVQIAALRLIHGIVSSALHLLHRIAHRSLATPCPCAKCTYLNSDPLVRERSFVREALNRGMSYEAATVCAKVIFSSGDVPEVDISELRRMIGSEEADQLLRLTRVPVAPARNGTATGYGEGGEGLIR